MDEVDYSMHMEFVNMTDEDIKRKNRVLKLILYLKQMIHFIILVMKQLLH
jgi:hypothetical protein